MLIMGGVIFGICLGIGGIILGLQAFRPEGIPLSQTRNLTGKGVRVVGITCMAFGIILAGGVILGALDMAGIL
jgi:hypothetical protein